MPRVDFELNNFKGIHNEPAKTPAGETYAHDLLNLRVDGDGWLQKRASVEPFLSSVGISGIAASPTHFFYLRDGSLWIRDKENLSGGAVRAVSNTAPLFVTETDVGTEALFTTSDVDESETVEIRDTNDVLARFEGRISLVSFGDFVILTSEGQDQGVWVDLSRPSPFVPRVYQLGITPPQTGFSAHLVERESGIDPTDTWLGIDWLNPDDARIPILQYNSRYFYRITYLRDTEVFDCESNPSVYVVVNTPSEEGNPWPAVNLSQFIHSEDTQVTGVNIYRSVRMNPDDDFNENIPFRWIGTVSKGVTTFEDNAIDFSPEQLGVEAAIDAETVLATSGSLAFIGAGASSSIVAIGASLGTTITPGLGTAIGAAAGAIIGAAAGIGGGDTDLITLEEIQRLQFWESGLLLRLDNDRLPPEVKQIVEHNGNIFGAAGDRLVYSDLRYGNPALWAFPAVNEIRLQGPVDFCATTLGELRGRTNVLLFGSQNQMARLSGIDEESFAIDVMGHQGPVSPFAWTGQSGAVAFVGEKGLFLVSGGQIQMISDLALNDFFKDKKIIDGAVMFFQDNDLLFYVETENEQLTFKLEDGTWSRWDDIAIKQSTQIVSDNETLELFLSASGPTIGQIQRIQWNEIEGDADSDWAFESQPIDLGGPLKNRRKRFSQLQFTGEATGDITLQTFRDDEVEPVTSTFTSRDDLYPARVPIQRVARRLKFRVSGTGPVKIQGLNLGIII